MRDRVRNQRFIEAVTPVLERLKNDWFDPDGGGACTYCDMECSRPGGDHDKDCLARLGRFAIMAFESIRVDPKFDSDYWKNPRTPEDAQFARTFSQRSYLLETFFPKALPHLTVLDYREMESQGLTCYCNMFHMSEPLTHHKDCPVEGLRYALAEFLT